MDKVKLREEQLKLKKEIIIKDHFKKVKTIGGVFQFVVDDNIIASIVVCKLSNYEIIEKANGIKKTNLSYMPGYLFFREGPAILEAYHKLENKPDILMVHGHGSLHPIGFGIASHLGVVLDVPCFGVAKSLMIGDIEEDGVYINGLLKGVVFKTKEKSNPLYVSAGHKISLTSSVKFVKESLKGHKFPEPLHLAHKYGIKLKRKLK